MTPPFVLWPPIAWIVLGVWATAAAVTALVIWSRRLTGPITPAGLRTWRDRIRNRPDGEAREATVGWWSAFHDGLLGRAFRRHCGRAARAGTVLHGRMGDAVQSHAALRAARRHRAELGPPSRRPYVPMVVANWVLPVATGWADWVFTSSVMHTSGLFASEGEARIAAVPTAIVLVLAGRMIAAAVLERRPAWAAAGVSAALVLAATLAGVQARAAGASPARDWFVLVLAPTVVSVFGSLLSHVVAPDVEAADQAVRRATWSARWSSRGLVRALSDADGRRTELASFVAARLLARPHAAANGDAPPIDHHDVIALLHEIGVIVEPDLVERGHVVLEQLSTELDTHRSTHLRSAA